MTAAITSPVPLRVLIAGGEAAHSSVTIALVRGWGDAVAVQVGTLDDAREALDAGRVDCAVVHVDTDQIGSALGQLRAANPAVPIVAVCDWPGDQHSLAMIRAGVQECVAARSLTGPSLRQAVDLAMARVGGSVDLARRAMHDSLTDLPNRTLVLDRLESARRRTSRTGRPLAVLFLDLDGFKLINDALGHPAGDDVLVMVAQRLSAVVRPADTVGRLGGDEFVVLCEDTDEAGAFALGQRIRVSIAEPMRLGGTVVEMDVSIGVVVADGNRPPAQLIRDADTAMYRAKENGRGRVEFFTAEMQHRAMRRLEMVSALRSALPRGFPVDTVKIDRSLLCQPDDARARRILASVIDLVHALGLSAVAEGVEADASVIDLRRLGCDFGQGFYWGKPASRRAHRRQRRPPPHPPHPTRPRWSVRSGWRGRRRP